MAKSRVEKNKDLYDELEMDSFELEDISEVKKEIKAEVKEELKEEMKAEAKIESQVEVKDEVVETKKQEIVPVNKPKKNEMVAVKKDKKKKEVVEEDFVITQPISYTDKLSIEEILRAKLEKQQKLKDSKKGYKKTPVTDSYTPEMMQKNINVKDGVDIRKEANIRVKKGNNKPIVLLVLLLIAVIGAAAALIFVIM